MPRILFVTTHNLAANPRIVKEVELALANGFEVELVCFGFDNWSKSINDSIVARLGSRIRYHEIPGERKPFLPWLISSFKHIFASKATAWGMDTAGLLSWQSNKRSSILNNYLHNIQQPADLVIAHNPGSFYPVQQFATRHRIPYGIDLEDYHPGETIDDAVGGKIKKLLKLTLPGASYISAASPLIMEHSMEGINYPPEKSMVIMNYFDAGEFVEPKPGDEPRLRLVWFSQHIALRRGLEPLLEAMKEHTGTELHLYGNCDPSFYAAYLEGRADVIVHPPLPQPALHRELALYDVGLALEPGRDMNNKYAISNKILAYRQAGLYILASDTPAQQKLVADDPSIGKISSLDIQALSDTIGRLLLEKEQIRRTAPGRFKKAIAHNWQQESATLLHTWKTLTS